MSVSASKRLAFLVDTNVWIDFFVDRGLRHDSAVSFVIECCERGIPLLTAIESTKDVYFAVSCELKRMQREAGEEVTEAFANAANEVAWSCLSTLRKHASIVAADASDMVEALVQRTNHGDYEDNLVIAAALRSSATHIVSSDVKLQKHSPIPCIGFEEAMSLVNAR